MAIVFKKYRIFLSIIKYTYTEACGLFFEKSQANPKSDILTWPCSSNRIFAGFKSLYTINRLCMCSKPERKNNLHLA